MLLFQTSGLVQLSQLCSLLKLQPCWNQSTFVSMLPSVPLQSNLFPSPFAFIFPQTQAPRHTLLFLAFPHSLSFLVFFPLKRIHADLNFLRFSRMSFRELSLSAEGWMLTSFRGSFSYSFCPQMLTCDSMTEAPSARGIQGRTPVLSPPSSTQATQHIMSGM